MIDYNYIVRTTDGKDYDYINPYSSLVSVYKDVMSMDYIEVTKSSNHTEVVINTKHIVSIERW